MSNVGTVALLHGSSKAVGKVVVLLSANCSISFPYMRLTVAAFTKSRMNRKYRKIALAATEVCKEWRVCFPRKKIHKWKSRTQMKTYGIDRKEITSFLNEQMFMQTSCNHFNFLFIPSSVILIKRTKHQCTVFYTLCWNGLRLFWKNPE